MTDQNVFAGMLRAVNMNPAQAFHYSMKWTREGYTQFGASSSCQVLHPWVAPETGTLWHQAWVRGSHSVSEDFKSRVILFMEFWSEVEFAVGPALTPEWRDYNIGDAQRALVGARDLRHAGFDHSSIIHLSKLGRFHDAVDLVHDGVPRTYIDSLL